MPGLSVGLAYNHLGLTLASIPASQSLLVQKLPGNKLTITADSTVLTISVSEPTVLSGTYVVDPRDLANGPINLVPPVLLPPFHIERTLALTVGLWIYDAALGLPQVNYRWVVNGVEELETTVPSYTPTATDTTVRVRETLVQANGQNRFAQSATVTIA